MVRAAPSDIPTVVQLTFDDSVWHNRSKYRKTGL